MKKIQAPKIPPHLLPPAPLTDEESYQGCAFTTDLLGDYHNLDIKFSSFSKLDWANSQQTQLQLSDVVLENVNLANSEWLGASLARVIFKNCRLTGFNLSESYLTDVQFIDCQLDYASFSYGKLNYVAFLTCNLTEADFLMWLGKSCPLKRAN